MPIYEYQCRGCGHAFELLVLPPNEPSCPQCEGIDLERLLSLPSVSSSGTRERNLNRARRKEGLQTRRDQAHADHDVMKHYHEEH